MKLRTKLAAVLSSGAALILLVCFGLAYVLVRRDEVRDLDNELADVAASMLDEVDQRSLADGTHWNSFDRRGYVALYSETGELLRASARFAGTAPTSVTRGNPTYGDLEQGGESLRWITVHSSQPSTGATLLVAQSRTAMLEDMRFLREVFGTLFVLGLLGSVALAWLVSRDIARDLAKVSFVTRNVATGDLSTRVVGGSLSSKEMQDLAGDLNQMIEDLERVINAQRVFVSHAAHELRSPLATMRGELQLSLRKDRSKEELHSTLEIVHEQATELSNLAEGLLSLARSGERTSPIPRAAVNSGEITQAALALAKSNAIELGVELRVEQHTEARVLGDTSDLARALRNLLDNAVAHSPKGGAVHLDVRAHGTELLFTVEDDGPGVAPQDVEHLFVPFWRAQQDQGSGKGAGLGLSIAREIATRYGGDIHYEPSARTRGARFSLVLPIATDASA
jgi:two-component system, OmpR family, sensor kinase